MKHPIFKSIASVIAGMAVGAILSVGTDKILELTGAMKTDPFNANPIWLIATVVVYRSAYNSAGAYLTARIAPTKPMKHVIILGIIGLVFGIIGTVTMWHIPPHWYPISLVLLTMPAVWLGGKLAIKNINNKN